MAINALVSFCEAVEISGDEVSFFAVYLLEFCFGAVDDCSSSPT